MIHGPGGLGGGGSGRGNLGRLLPGNQSSYLRLGRGHQWITGQEGGASGEALSKWQWASPVEKNQTRVGSLGHRLIRKGFAPVDHSSASSRPRAGPAARVLEPGRRKLP